MRVPASHHLAKQAIAQLQAGPRDRRGDRAFALITGQAQPKGPRKSKYGSKRVKVDGIWFDSAKEGRRWTSLCLMQRAGTISDLRRQVPYELGGEPVIKYVADFVYRETATGQVVVEDVKSKITRKIERYQLKLRLMRTVHNIEIREV